MHDWRFRALLLSLAGAMQACSTPCLSAEPAASISFERDIRPVLKTYCVHCHGEENRFEGNLDVRLRRLMTAGGDSGPAIVPGKPDESYLLERIVSGEMPPAEATQRPADKHVRLIRRWIEQGAPTLREEPQSVDEIPLISEEELEYWAFQPITRPDVPVPDAAAKIRTPVDAFILRRLESEQLTLNQPASRTTLIRRATLDLLGLAPTPREIAQFLADDRPGAYERLIDRLLASPHYGERWGRHWLDVAGYADSEGYTDDDLERKQAWRYRDYVIRSFNDNKPFDRFVHEQLAGDELVGPPYSNLSPESADLLIATGFLRMAADGTAGAVDDAAVATNATIADSLKIVSSTLLGLTVGCAECHNHRYDPIPQEDYYSLRAVFEPAYDWQQWRTPQKRLLSLYSDADRAEAARLEAEAKSVEQQRAARQQELIAATLELQLAKIPEGEREAVRAAQMTAEKGRTDEQKELLKKYPMVNVTASSLYLYDKQAADELKKLAEQAAAIRSRKPVEEFIRVLTEVPGRVPESRVFVRGDHEQPGKVVDPDVLSVISMTAADADIPVNDETLATTGRRLAFAHWLTGERHPLTARVLVNRVWMQHFGRGIVSTPGDFGILGEAPTHPQLLDWLASEFISNGWDLKELHRQILLSATYRQTSEASSEALRIDPDNRLLSRAPIRRLEAEILRDVTLQLSGQLNTRPFGPPVPVMADRVGRFVIGIENLNAGRPGDVIPMHGEDLRRTVYVQVRRSRPLSLLETFDAPRMDPNCEVRSASTVAPQSLSLMNGDFFVEHSRQLAALAMAEASQRDQRLHSIWLRVYGRPPAAGELSLATSFLDEQVTLATQAAGNEPVDATAIELQALGTVCHMLLSSNEFLYVD